MKKLLPCAMIVGAMMAVPAAAASYDAFSSFTGTSTGGSFTYGIFDGTDFTAFNDAAGCAALISGSSCTSNGFVPAVFKSTTGAHQSASVIVPGNALLFYPGSSSAQAAAVLFTAPQTGVYNVSFSGAVADTNPSGVLLQFFVPGFFGISFASLDAAHPVYSDPTFSLGQAFTFALQSGSTFGFAINHGGGFSGDATSVNLTVSTVAVPEPASWAMFIGGFGVVGGALRSRRRTRVTFASAIAG